MGRGSVGALRLAAARPRDQMNGVSLVGKTGVTADRDKIEFRLFNSSSVKSIVESS